MGVMWRQTQAFFFAALLLSAEASRLETPPELAGTGMQQQADKQPTRNAEIAAQIAMDASSLAEFNSSRIFAADESNLEHCNEFCITCPANGDSEISWHIKRARGGLMKLAGGVLAAGLATLGVVSGVLVVPVVIAGAAAAVGISATTAMIGGGLAGAYLVRDMMKEKRMCPSVEFHEVKHSNNKNWFKKEDKEETYQLDDVNLLELMSQMEDVQHEPWIQQYERNINVPEKERLTGLMACNLMRLSQKKWGDMRFQDPNYRKMMSMFPDSKGKPSSVSATVAECAKWLCSSKFEDPLFKDTQVKEMGSNWHGFSKCGGRSGWNVKNWFRR